MFLPASQQILIVPRFERNAEPVDRTSGCSGCIRQNDEMALGALRALQTAGKSE